MDPLNNIRCDWLGKVTPMNMGMTEKTLALVAKMTIVWTLQAISTVMRWQPSQMDVKNGFLNGSEEKSLWVC